jgi:hypothetical protein
MATRWNKDYVTFTPITDSDRQREIDACESLKSNTREGLSIADDDDDKSGDDDDNGD